MSLESQLTKLESELQKAYEEGTTLENAERLAAEFLHAQIKITNELQGADLDARMRKSGVKAIRGAIYTKICSESDKKPTEAAIEHTINMNDIVQGEQQELDQAEVSRDRLERYFNIFKDAHIFFRGIAKGKFD